jgi:type VI secretion system Hcp family effector
MAAEKDNTCLPAGQTRHFPVLVIREVDRYSPALLRALASGEYLQVTLTFNQKKAGKGDTFAVYLQNARIAGIRREMSDGQGLLNLTGSLLEKISFTYEAVTEEWLPTKERAAVKWVADCTRPLAADLNFDGIVNLEDFMIMADNWLMAVN